MVGTNNICVQPEHANLAMQYILIDKSITWDEHDLRT